ncbi:hypothetical protein R103_I10851 [Saccharomyces cerevisiae R103]|nr:hypothetical protein R103_I10851 [Saccharomyces cerevisiae R103]
MNMLPMFTYSGLPVTLLCLIQLRRSVMILWIVVIWVQKPFHHLTTYLSRLHMTIILTVLPNLCPLTVGLSEEGPPCLRTFRDPFLGHMQLISKDQLSIPWMIGLPKQIVKVKWKVLCDLGRT